MTLVYTLAVSQCKMVFALAEFTDNGFSHALVYCHSAVLGHLHDVLEGKIAVLVGEVIVHSFDCPCCQWLTQFIMLWLT